MADLTALLVMYMEEEVPAFPRSIFSTHVLISALESQEAWWTIVALIQRYAMAGLFTPVRAPLLVQALIPVSPSPSELPSAFPMLPRP